MRKIIEAFVSEKVDNSKEIFIYTPGKSKLGECKNINEFNKKFANKGYTLYTTTVIYYDDNSDETVNMLLAFKDASDVKKFSKDFGAKVEKMVEYK